MHISGLLFRRVSIVLLVGLVFTPKLSSFAEDDPFPGVAAGAEVSARQIINPKTGDPADGSTPINCPTGSGRSQVVNATTKEQYIVCVKNWRPTAVINADRDFRDRIESARAAAEAESKAWNAANPGKQKCVQWGPIVHANGVSTASGGVCANPVDPGPNSSVPTQSAPSVEAPTSSSNSSSTSTNSSGSSSNSSSGATTVSSGSTAPSSSETSTASSGSSATSTGSTSTSTANSSNSTSGSTSTSPTVSEDFSKWGSGTPYTRVLKGQLSTAECPSGFQGANGTIVAIGSGTFTECWPENAWAAYRLGGIIWEQFKSSGGTYDAKAEETRRSKVSELKALAKSVAQKAADQTPGIQRCSKWSGYGESGEECAYTFVKPDSSSTPTSSTSPSASDTKTATTSTGSPDTSTATTTSNSATSSTQTNTSDPFPNLKNGEEIPGTRVTSAPGLKQSEWEQTSAYKALTCPAGSGKASGVDSNFTISQSDDRWFAYCIKSFQQTSRTTPNAADTPTATTSSHSTSSSDTPTATTSSAQSSSSATNSNSVGVTSASSTNEAPTLKSTAIQVNGTVGELKNLASSVVEDPTEKKRLQGLLNKVDGVVAATSLKTIKLPGSAFFEGSAESKTPDICSVSGVSVNRLKKGVCVVAYTITDSNGNKFTTLKEIYFRK